MADKFLDNERYEREATHARGLAMAGDLDQAEKVLRALPRGREFCDWVHEKVDVAINISKARAALGQGDSARSLLALISPDIESLEGGGHWEAADCYLRMAKIHEMLGGRAASTRFLSKAANLAQRHEDKDADCRKILAEVARSFAAIGDRDQAKATALMISYPILRQLTLNEIGLEP